MHVLHMLMYQTLFMDIYINCTMSTCISFVPSMSFSSLSLPSALPRGQNEQLCQAVEDWYYCSLEGTIWEPSLLPKQGQQPDQHARECWRISLMYYGWSKMGRFDHPLQSNCTLYCQVQFTRFPLFLLSIPTLPIFLTLLFLPTLSSTLTLVCWPVALA